MAKKTRSNKPTPARAAASKGASTAASRGPSPAPKAPTKPATDRDRQTSTKLVTLADAVVRSSLAGREPKIAVPTRALSNTKWNKSRRILEMGPSAQERELFNLSMAKKFMQTVLHADGLKDLIDQGKTSSLRGMFYKGLHTIAGTKEKTFTDQGESDEILEDLEVAVGALREELHVYAKKKGTMIGNITIIDSGDEIDCRRMGSGGYAIPSIVEPDVIQFKQCDAEFVLHVEKDTVWARFNEDKFWQTHNCILTEGGGQPSRGVRRLLQRLSSELNLPVYCLLDCDPWGHYIYSVIKQGSISLAFESSRLAIPDAKFIGIRSHDYQKHALTDDAQIALNDRDIARAKQIAAYPWFKDHKGWQKEIDTLLKNGFKMEVEALITKDISYVTETYVPQVLAEKAWLS
ncbi:MAG: DNA topoisomerase IV subunit A [Phycisphaeraceae bacterium]|nr:DNA topoisomerase IV subunit A [Phycisphaeraceae bacterium]